MSNQLPKPSGTFDISIILCNDEVINLKMQRAAMVNFRNNVWQRGTIKKLADGSIELISPLIIKTIIIKPVK